MNLKLIITIILLMIFSGCLNNESKNSTTILTSTPTPKLTPTPEITPIPEITSTPEVTPEPTITPEITPETYHEIIIVDKIGMHNKQINNILNHTDPNIIKFINKIEIYYTIKELNMYCENIDVYGCTDGKNIAIVSTQMWQARNDRCSGDSCYYYSGSFAETFLHEIGHVEGMNLYDDNSEFYARNYSKNNYKFELEYNFDAEKIYTEYLKSGNKDNKHLN